MDTNWVIARQPDTAIPAIGQEYEIRDSRKGTFTGKILNVRGEFADVEVTSGVPHFAGFESKLAYEGYLSIRAGLCYLIAVEPANKASSRTAGTSRQNSKSKSKAASAKVAGSTSRR